MDSKETESLSLTVIKLLSTGAKELESFNNYDHASYKQNHENITEFSLVLAIVTPKLMELLMSHKNLTIDAPNSSNKKMLMMMCGVDVLKMFEIDQWGRTLSSRFMSYSDWVKFNQHEYLDTITIVDEYLKKEKLTNDKAKSCIEHQTKKNEYVKQETFEDTDVYLEEEKHYDTYKCMNFPDDHYFQVTNEDDPIQKNSDESNLDDTNISVSNENDGESHDVKVEENIYLCTNILNKNKELTHNEEYNLTGNRNNNEEEDNFDYYNLDEDVLEGDVQGEEYDNNGSDSDNYIMIGATNSNTNTDKFSKKNEKKAIKSTNSNDLDIPLALSSVTDKEPEKKYHYTYHQIGSQTMKHKHSSQYLSLASQHKKRNSENCHQTISSKPLESQGCKERGKSQIKRRETIKYKTSDFQKQKNQRGKQSLLIDQPFKIFPSEIKCEVGKDFLFKLIESLKCICFKV